MGGPSYQNGIDVQPYETADIGASTTSGNWNGGGSPNGGLPTGSPGGASTATFTFGLMGTGVGALTETSFLNALTENPQGGQFGLLTGSFPWLQRRR